MVLFYILCRFWNCSRYHFQPSMLIVCVLHRHGSCVNPLGIARSQSHSNFMLLQWETLLIGLFISSVKIHKIQCIHMVHISVHIYCLITCNIKSLLIVLKISHIFRKTCQVSRFPAKSSDSRNKFVFLPKQPLLELSAPVIWHGREVGGTLSVSLNKSLKTKIKQDRDGEIDRLITPQKWCRWWWKGHWE